MTWSIYDCCNLDHVHFKPQNENVTLLSRVALFGGLTKQDRCKLQLNERSQYSRNFDRGVHKVSDDTISQRIRQEVMENKNENFKLGFFALSGAKDSGSQPIPRDVLHLIMSFIPAFPYYFVLKSVCRQWFHEFQEHIFAKVEHLSLVDDGKPKYYFRREDDGHEILVQFKPFGLIGTQGRMSDFCYPMLNPDKTHLFEFLAQSFPNVKHLRLGLGSIDCTHFKQCVPAMFPKLTQLETLDIIDTVNYYQRGPFWVMQKDILEMIARSLPSSTKNLNFIGVTLLRMSELEMLKMFSKKGRQSISESLHPSSMVEQNSSVDIQNLSLSYSFLDGLNIDDCRSLKEMYSDCEMSVVDSRSHSDSASSLPVFSYVEYLNYMSKKEGIVLSVMKDVQRRLMSDTSEIIETVIDIAVQEHAYFQPLLSLPAAKTGIQIESRTKLDAEFMLRTEKEFLPKMLELLADPSRMKYSELVFNIDSTFFYEEKPRTLLNGLISNCYSEQDFNMIKTIIETYKPSLAVNGVNNYLYETSFSSLTPVRTELMKYLVCLKPDLINLGDSEGIINDSQKDLPIIQLILSRWYPAIECLEEIKFLVSAGALLTQVDKHGNNILHSACECMEIELVKYLSLVCPESFMFERNKRNQTPLELLFTRPLRASLRPQFLNEVVHLPCFKDQPLKDYKTSCGNLLHAALYTPHLETIQWFLQNGFDANALNENGENAFFRCISRKESGYGPGFVDEIAVELIKAGAQIELENKERNTVVTFGLQNNKNYRMVKFLVQTAGSLSSKQWSTLLAPRMKHGLNALHYFVKKMVEIMDSYSEINRDKAWSQHSDCPIAKHCALLCLEHHPEMLYERSEPSDEQDLKYICGVSPLQMLLEARHGLYLLSELSIKLSDIANQPVFKSKNTADDMAAPIPVMYLASEVAIDISMFDELMKLTDNVLVRDEARETRPNLLHIAAERSVSLCECIIKHWKERYPDPGELSQLINQSLENDGRRYAATIASSSGFYDIVRMLCSLMEAVDS